SLLRLYPDLSVKSVTVPASVTAGQSFSVTWVIENLSSVTAQASSFIDRLSIETANGTVLLGEVTRTGPILGETSVTITRSFVMPTVPAGDYRARVETDRYGANQEPDTRANNTGSSVDTISVGRIAPDLVIGGLEVAPNAVQDDVLTVKWNVTNNGQQDTGVASWTDRVYLSRDGVIDGNDTLLGAFLHSGALAVGGTYANERTVTVPRAALGEFRILVRSDADGQVDQQGRTGNDLASAPITIAAAPAANLVTSALSAPGQVQAGAAVALSWTVTNAGNKAATESWVDRIFVERTDGTGRTFLADVARPEGLAAGAAYSQNATITMPQLALGSYRFVVVSDVGNTVDERAAEGADNETNAATSIVSPNLVVSAVSAGTASVTLGLGLSGRYRFIVVTDAGNAVNEIGGEGDNGRIGTTQVTLSPYADLSVSNVTAPERTIRDPAVIDIGWTVTNNGTGLGRTGAWEDVVVLSADDIYGNGDDRVLGRFAHDGMLAVGASYNRTEQFFLPAGYSGRVNVFVRTDATDAVFENGSEANNTAARAGKIDIMPVAYADLVIASTTVPPDAQSGRPATISWSVKNQGIGRTNSESWTDTVFVFADAGLTQLIAAQGFDHIGALAKDEGYSRSGTLNLPNGLTGTVYVLVQTGGPFEFVYTDNNRSVAKPMAVTLSPSADLRVDDLAATATVSEGGTIDVAWRVVNDGEAEASGRWTDTLVLQPIDTTKPPIVIGSFVNERVLAAGQSYQRTERFTLPQRIEGVYRLVVTTNADRGLYETSAAQLNNSATDDGTVSISLNERPNLQVQNVVATPRVTAGGTVSVEFDIVNQGNAATSTPFWQDAVYLSLDDKLSPDDILIQRSTNQAALASGERYRTQTTTGAVPLRFGGDAYIIVAADSSGNVDEYPNERDNAVATRITVDPIPKSDLIVSNTVAPAQAVYGSEIEVRFKVTNNGAARTYADTWQDTVWITRDARRPNTSPKAEDGEANPGTDFIKGNSAILLGTVTHVGELQVGGSYEVTMRVRIPSDIASGTYYITPWSDSFDIVLEDTLATNVNPDDPNELDSNNYKARRIDVIGFTPAKPDLVMESVTATPHVVAGKEQLTVSWRVSNRGPGNADPDRGWYDEVYLSDKAEWNAPGATVWSLGNYAVAGLPLDGRYTATQTYDLPPSAKGLYVHVLAANSSINGLRPFIEVTAANNRGRADSVVVNTPADLVVESVTAATPAYSGEQTDISWTVRNNGGDVWDKTQYWVDNVYISLDPVFDGSRATLLDQVAHGNATPLAAGQSYTATSRVTLPKGLEGPYFIYVFTDAAPARPYPMGEVLSGSASDTIAYYAKTAYESRIDNNTGRGNLPVIYREPDLRITALSVPAGGTSGQPITVNWTATNEGTRKTREDSWLDRVFISRDASLDSGDLMLGEYRRRGALDIGGSYNGSLSVDLPEGIDGPFYILVQTDATATAGSIYSGSRSNIDPNRPGVVPAADLVPEFRDEGDNTAVAAIQVAMAAPPNLQVTSVTAPPRLLTNSTFDVTWTVKNNGTGATPPTQS
ncbi:MAG: hypothetical protein EOP23_21425, partial [Hyphomicrobiales bacterium]